MWKVVGIKFHFDATDHVIVLPSYDKPVHHHQTNLDTHQTPQIIPLLPHYISSIQMHLKLVVQLERKLLGLRQGTNQNMLDAQVDVRPL